MGQSNVFTPDGHSGAMHGMPADLFQALKDAFPWAYWHTEDYRTEWICLTDGFTIFKDH